MLPRKKEKRCIRTNDNDVMIISIANVRQESELTKLQKKFNFSFAVVHVCHTGLPTLINMYEKLCIAKE